jgi:hyaluronan synthase
MEPSASECPHTIPDRRRRAKARPRWSDRRQATRYAAAFPVEIHVGGPEGTRIYHATARDVSDGGLRIEARDVPPQETRVRLDFRIPDGVMPEEYLHGRVTTAAEVCYRAPGGGTLGVAFEEPLRQRLGRSLWRGLRFTAAVVAVVTTLLILSIKLDNLRFFWFDALLFTYSLLVGFYLLTRFLFASFYRASQPLPDLPTLSLIVPVFNEESHIERTLRHVMESDYPAEKLQVIAVNDGSTDGSRAAIQRARERYPEIVFVNLDESRGKRVALAAGVRLATGDVIVFIDSDSFLEPDALRHLTNRFRDPAVAAVTGHCEVENAWTNTLTRMQAARYFIAFRVLKAAESVFESVTCLSGPLSAYRREVLLQHLDVWMGQTFLGKPATFGDDRSLTNLLLRHNRRTVYECAARTRTIVPHALGVFFRQQMRWKRSWFRESLRACVFMWRKEPLVALSFYLGFLLPILGPLIVFRALIYVPLLHHGTPLAYLTGVFLMSSLMSSTYLFVKRSRLWAYAVVFCFFYMFVLIWQLPWAMLTVAKTHWGTRG